MDEKTQQEVLTVLMVDGTGFEPAFVLSNFFYQGFNPPFLYWNNCFKVN
jgi:hypothetical protein